MSSRVKTMGAGLACSSTQKVNVNLNTCGGDKKQGLPPYTSASSPWAIRALFTRSNGSVDGRSTIFTLNQLGGVSSSSFSSANNNWTSGRGVKNIPSYVFKMNK
jgi:hypothetical protein